MKRWLLLALALWATPALAVDPGTRVGDAAYSILATDTRIYTTATLTTGRTWTLPAASATCIGQTCAPPSNALEIIDSAGAISSSGQLTIAPASGNTINGNAANLIITGTGSRIILFPVSGSDWRAIVHGDYQVSTVAVASAVSLTTATAKTITSLSLSQGVWDCSGVVHRNLGATTSVTLLSTSISGTTDTAGTLDTSTMAQFATAANVMVNNTSHAIGPIRLVLAATTSEFLVAKDTFTVSTNAGYGQLLCRRVP